MQNKNKKNLYKIIFITILLGFIISLVGCDWFSLGLLNIFDPQAQIRVNYTEIDLTEGVITLEIHSINEVEFIGTGFEYDYYNGTTKISSLSKIVGETFYVAPSDTPGLPGEITTINLLLYYQEAQDYMIANPSITELTCTITLIGTDGSGHDITIPITVDLPALPPGVDTTPPVANIATTPSPATGVIPFTVGFDASGSTVASLPIVSYVWAFTGGDPLTATGVTAVSTFIGEGTWLAKLTVTDSAANVYVAFVTVTANP